MTKVVAIVGATGFVGKYLIDQLKDNVEIRALSRRTLPPSGNIQYVKCDLFSLKQLESALTDVDTAIYLVHSMQPKKGLLQGSFQDFDLFLADNFARAVRKCNVRKVIYLGGIIPKDKPSKHLLSRFEVETVISNAGSKFFGLRAGIIVGAGGSSFEMLKKIVERLPVMICPRWTQNLSNPIAIDDVVRIIKKLVDLDDVESGAYDIGGPETLSYVDLMRKTAEAMHYNRHFFMTRYLTLSLSKLWVRVFGSAPYSLVSPLVDSLKHSIELPELKLQNMLGLEPSPMDQTIEKALREISPHQQGSAIDSEHLVTSIQRLPLPRAMTMQNVAKQYEKWLYRFFWPFLNVSFANDKLTFNFSPLKVFGISPNLFELKFSPERSSVDRVLFYITGGLLDQRSSDFSGRLEFREVMDRKFMLAAVLQFKPRIPWRIYRLTQSQVHLFVMHFFGKHLKKIASRE